MKLEIHLEFANTEAAQRTLNAVRPDNEPLPAGLSIESIYKETSVHFSIDCSRGIDSLRYTFEDLMGAVDLSLRTTEQIE
ncbi:MAG: KEOPS complex subunit Pcc1 [Promethearchaeia archaeon]